MNIFAEWPESQLRFLYVTVACIAFPAADFVIRRFGRVATHWSRWAIWLLFLAMGARHFVADAESGNVTAWFDHDVVYSTPANQELYDDGYSNTPWHASIGGREFRNRRYVKHPWTACILVTVLGAASVRYRDRHVEVNRRSTGPRMSRTVQRLHPESGLT